MTFSHNDTLRQTNPKGVNETPRVGMKFYHFTNDLYGNYSHSASDLTEAIEKLIEELSENRTFFVRLLFNNETCLLIMLQNDPVLFKISNEPLRGDRGV